MRDFIAFDDDSNVVGKWRRHNLPTVPDKYNLEEVSDVSDYDVDYWWDEQ